MARTTTEPIIFAGTDILSVEGLFITGTDTYRFPSRKVTTSDLANANKGVTTSAFYSTRPITIRGIISRYSREQLDGSIGELRRILNPLNQTLTLPLESSQRDFYNTTLSNMTLSNAAGGYIEFSAEMIASDPHSYDTITTESLNIINITSGDKSYPVYFEGTAEQLPVITYTVDSVVDGTNQTVTFSNPNSSVDIAITRTWEAAEVLIVDCFNRTVQVDGTDVDFDGNFPEWSTGNGFVNYTDSFTERQVDINVVYKKRYL